jgi:hypothetical protein
MSKIVYSVVGTLIVVALAFVFNPSPGRHRAKIETSVAERSQLAGVMGIGALTAFVSNYHSLGVASYTTVNERVASFGAFGIIVVTQ